MEVEEEAGVIAVVEVGLEVDDFRVDNVVM
jgi:hypothetical protein